VFELTNEQRKCFGLLPVESTWILTEVKASPYDDFQTFVYIDGTVIRKCILSGNDRFVEYELCEQLSEDLKYLLPKTAKGKPALLSSSTLLKRNGFGMRLAYGKGYISLDNRTSMRTYYSSVYDPLSFNNLEGFAQWVLQWCADTTIEDCENITRFSLQARKHVKYQEGDVFRFKINRRQYGYGRIILDYDKMRKKKEPFWDILMTKPLVCSVYHIVTENKHLTINELGNLQSLPSTIITDNDLFYGDFEIIGNIPLGEKEDYPIIYGKNINLREPAVCLQCGRLYRKIDNGPILHDYLNDYGVSFDMDFELSVLKECIAAGSNAPYWEKGGWFIDHDLRNPKLYKEREEICEQFGIPASQLMK
jgi:hypothetical protein